VAQWSFVAALAPSLATEERRSTKTGTISVTATDPEVRILGRDRRTASPPPNDTLAREESWLPPVGSQTRQGVGHMNTRQMLVRVTLGSVLIIGAMGEMTLCAGEEAPAPDAKAEAKKPTREEIEKVGQKIRAAVEAGEITAEEGRAKMQAYLKSIGAPDARKPKRGRRLEREWRELHEELAAQGMGRETWGELFKKKERGEVLEPKEEEAIRRIMELKKRANRGRTGRERQPGELVLDRFRGTWFSDVVVSPSEWVSEGKQRSEVREVRWILNGRFQESTIRGDKHETREIQRVGGKTYYKWMFGTERFGHGYWTGTWDEEAKTMTWKLDFGAVKGTMVDSFADPDPNYMTTLVFEDAEGKVLFESQTEHTRLLAK